MPFTYPGTWVARVQKAEKLARTTDGKSYRSGGGREEVPADVVNRRLAAYLKAEAARRRRKLSKDDEQLCQQFVLMVANWQTGHWLARSADETPPRPLNARPKTRASASSGELRRAS